MADIITLTAPHLNGVIFSVLRNEDHAAHVLKSVYSNVWTSRHIKPSSPDLLNALRAIAHRYALHYKYMGVAAFENDTLGELQVDLGHSENFKTKMSTEETDILERAYLGKHDETMRDKITDIVSTTARGVS
ncbi:MAG: hypothetical protein ACSHXY_02170 [Alphaproteobacteria bacterium]